MAFGSPRWSCAGSGGRDLTAIELRHALPLSDETGSVPEIVGANAADQSAMGGEPGLSAALATVVRVWDELDESPPAVADVVDHVDDHRPARHSGFFSFNPYRAGEASGKRADIAYRVELMRRGFDRSITDQRDESVRRAQRIPAKPTMVTARCRSVLLPDGQGRRSSSPRRPRGIALQAKIRRIELDWTSSNIPLFSPRDRTS